jgi:CelD/BcsL family acetyltransferase involved in cellulose biosynthesis
MASASILCPAVTAQPSTVVIDDPLEMEALRPAWTSLLERSSCNEITLTPDWLSTWWRVFGPRQGRQLRLVLLFEADRLIGLAPLLRRRHWYRPGIPFRRLEFLASGERHGEGICSNYLNVIAESGAENEVSRRLVQAIVAGELGAWDEVVLPMMAGDGPMPALMEAAFTNQGIPAEIAKSGGAPYIPLPSTWDAYLKALSRSHRRLLVRSLRAFDEWSNGDSSLERVTLSSEVDKGKKILTDLHHARWEADGESGVFRSPPFLQFHDTIMPTLLNRGALELLWLSVHGKPVAALYSMVWNDKVYAYQMGRQPDTPANIRLGAVIIAHAIRLAIESGRREFDMLADVTQFKQQLTLATRPLVQVRAVHPCWREKIRLGVEESFRCFRYLRQNARALIKGVNKD